MRGKCIFGSSLNKEVVEPQFRYLIFIVVFNKIIEKIKFSERIGYFSPNNIS